MTMLNDRILEKMTAYELQRYLESLESSHKTFSKLNRPEIPLKLMSLQSEIDDVKKHLSLALTREGITKLKTPSGLPTAQELIAQLRSLMRKCDLEILKASKGVGSTSRVDFLKRKIEEIKTQITEVSKTEANRNKERIK